MPQKKNFHDWRAAKRNNCPDGHQVCRKCDKTMPDHAFSINTRTGELTKTCTECLEKRRVTSSATRPYDPSVNVRSTKNVDNYLRQFLAIRVSVDHAK